MPRLQNFKLRKLPNLLFPFLYWEIIIPLWRTPPKFIFGNTIGYRRNIIPRIKNYLNKRKNNHVISGKNKKLIKELEENGYLRLPKIDPDKIKSLQDEYQKCLSSSSKTFFMLNGGNQTFIKDPLLNMPGIKNILDDLKPLLFDISNGNDYYITQTVAMRNIHIDDALDHRDTGLSNAFHNDGISYRDKSIFVLLSDNVTRNTGATKFINKKDSIKLSRNFGYFSRRFISKRFIKKLYDKADFFEGSAGDIYILNTSQCLHGATIPKKDSYRDILVFIYTEDKPSKNIDSQPVLYSKTSSKK